MLIKYVSVIIIIILFMIPNVDFYPRVKFILSNDRNSRIRLTVHLSVMVPVLEKHSAISVKRAKKAHSNEMKRTGGRLSTKIDNSRLQ